MNSLADVAIELRKLSETIRHSPSVTDARLCVIRFLTRPDVREVLGNTRIEWMKRDLRKATDVASVDVFISNTARYLEKDDGETRFSASWEDLARSGENFEMDTSPLYNHGPIVGKRKKRKGRLLARQSSISIAKEIPPELKLKTDTTSENPSAKKWDSMNPRQKTKVAQQAGFSENEARDLARLEWEGLDPSVKSNLEWVLKAPSEHLREAVTYHVWGREKIGPGVRVIVRGIPATVTDIGMEELEPVFEYQTDDGRRHWAYIDEISRVVPKGEEEMVKSRALDEIEKLLSDRGVSEADIGRILVYLRENVPYLRDKYDVELAFGGTTVSDEDVDALSEEIVFILDKHGMARVKPEISERFLAPMVPMGAASAGGAGYWGPSEKRQKEAFPGQLPHTGHVEQDGPAEDPSDEDILRALEDKIQSMADASAAEGWSIPTDEMTNRFGKDVWVMASFGDWVAVNGDLVFERPTPNPPKGYELTDFGGHVPTTEEEVSVESAVDAVAEEMDVPAERVQEVADSAGYGKFAYVSVSGDVEVWAKPVAEADAATVKRLPPYLSSSKKKAINKHLSEISKQYWNSMWEATEAIHQALREHGVEPEDYVITGEPSGRLVIKLFMAGEKVANSMLVLLWHRFPETSRYEVTAYVS